MRLEPVLPDALTELLMEAEPAAEAFKMGTLLHP